MTVRAKMQLMCITETKWGAGEGSKVLRFQSQYDTSIPEDQRFQKATPSATADFQIDNPAALEQFTPGKAYYLDFSPVPDAAPAAPKAADEKPAGT